MEAELQIMGEKETELGAVVSGFGENSSLFDRFLVRRPRFPLRVVVFCRTGQNLPILMKGG